MVARDRKRLLGRTQVVRPDRHLARGIRLHPDGGLSLSDKAEERSKEKIRHVRFVPSSRQRSRGSGRLARSRSGTPAPDGTQGQPIDDRSQEPDGQAYQPVHDRQRPGQDQQQDRDQAAVVVVPLDHDDLRALVSHGGPRRGSQDPANRSRGPAVLSTGDGSTCGGDRRSGDMPIACGRWPRLLQARRSRRRPGPGRLPHDPAETLPRACNA